MNAAGRHAMQEKACCRADAPREPASQLCDARQTFFAHALLDRRSISPTSVKQRVEAISWLTDPIGVGGDVTMSSWLQTVCLLHDGIDIKLVMEPHFPALHRTLHSYNLARARV